MYLSASFRNFRRSLIIAALSVATLCASLLTAQLQLDDTGQESFILRPSSPRHFSLEQTRALKAYWQAAARYRWSGNQPGYAQALSEARDLVGIDRLEYQSYPDRYLWLFDNTPNPFSSHGADVSLRLYHAQEFLDWLEALQTQAAAYPLQCRLWRLSEMDRQEPTARKTGNQFEGDGYGNDSSVSGLGDFSGEELSASEGGIQATAAGASRIPAQVQASCELVWFRYEEE